MKKNHLLLNGYGFYNKFLNKKNMLLGLFLISAIAFSQEKNTNQTVSDESLLNQYVKAKGEAIILFDSSNIKLFWTDNSVTSRNQAINILLREKAQSNESVPLRIQLANTRENQDCRIDVISEESVFSFSVLDNKLKTLSTSKKEDGFLNYSIASSVFHLEDTSGSIFNLVFNSKSSNSISIKKIILSFSENKASSFLSSPGRILYSSKDLNTSAKVSNIDTNNYSVAGKRTILFSSKKILTTTDNNLQNSVKIKNIGENATTIYIGYAVYNQNRTLLDGKNYPYKQNCNVLNVVSFSEKDNTIIVDAYSDWNKECYLALNVKNDLSDLPNTIFAGTIADVKKLDNGQSEITLLKPSNDVFKKGVSIRVHGKPGAYLYTQIITLKPGEEHFFSSKIKRDDGFLEYSSKAFSRGTYYVIPLIMSYSVDPNKVNKILISDFSVSF